MASIENIFAKFFGGTSNDREVKRLKPIVEKINQLAESYQDLTDEELKAKTPEFRYRLRMGETTDDILPEAFAVVKETCRRLLGKKWMVRGQEVEWNMVPYDVQLIGGIILHEGKIAEMATGEGKTLVATMPLYLNALMGKGAHLVTVNDYLAQRDCEWMGKIYEFLGLTAKALHNELDPPERRQVYNADITYGTNNEFGFDYLRDNMSVDVWSVVQRPLYYAIVDEVDSVLIDEARTPLIISGAVGAPPNIYNELKPVVANLYRKQQELVEELFRRGKELLEQDETAAGLALLRVHRGDPKNAKLLELLTSEFWVKKLIEKLQGEYEINKEMGKIDGELYYTIDEKSHVVDITEKGRIFLSGGRDQDIVYKIRMLDELDEQLGRITEQKNSRRFFTQDALTGACNGLSASGYIALCKGTGEAGDEEWNAVQKVSSRLKELSAEIAGRMQSKKQDRLAAARAFYHFIEAPERLVDGLTEEGRAFLAQSVNADIAAAVDELFRRLVHSQGGEDPATQAAKREVRNRFFDWEKQTGLPTAVKPAGEWAILVMRHSGDPFLVPVIEQMAALLRSAEGRSGAPESAAAVAQKNLDYFEFSDKGAYPKHISEKGRIAMLGGNPDLYILPDRTIVEERDRHIQELLDHTLNQGDYDYTGRVIAVERLETTLKQMMQLRPSERFFTQIQRTRSDRIEPEWGLDLTDLGRNLASDFGDQTKALVLRLGQDLQDENIFKRDGRGRITGLTEQALDRLLGASFDLMRKKIGEWHQQYKAQNQDNDVALRLALDEFLREAFPSVEAEAPASWSRKFEEVDRLQRVMEVIFTIPDREEWNEADRLRHLRRYFILDSENAGRTIKGWSDTGLRNVLAESEQRQRMAARFLELVQDSDVDRDSIFLFDDEGRPVGLQKGLRARLLDQLPFFSYQQEWQRLREEILRLTAKKVNSKQEADALLSREKAHLRGKGFLLDEREMNDLIYKAHAPNTVIHPEEIDAWCRLHFERLPRRLLENQRDGLWRGYTQIEERVQNISQLLRAYTLYHRDVDYVVKSLEENEVRRMGGQKGHKAVMIVDQFTGRLMPGRRFSDGLHEALEAKEGVEVQAESQTLATITIQNYFRLYKKLAGMTGTADTERQEFFSTYKLEVVVIPTNRQVIRKDENDVIFRTKKEKYAAIIDEALAMHEQGRPVLVGTVSVDVSQRLSEMLTQRGVPLANWLKKGDVSQEITSGRFHTVLNAKYHRQEAEIVAKAGSPGMITIATNMAGRGTDIKLPPEVVSKGGLHIIGSEKHEARRIDRQLRGRAGRQGDPGSSRFYLSLEDDLMRLFGSDRITTMMSRLGPMEEGERIEHPLITKSIERAQKKVEERNFEIRKSLLEYDTVLNEQRKIIYKRRQNLLGFAEAEDFVASKAKRFFNEEEDRSEWQLEKLIQTLSGFFGRPPDFTAEDLEGRKASEIKERVLEWVQAQLQETFEMNGLQLRHRLLGFCRMEDLIAELVLLKIRLHHAGTRDTARWNLDGIRYEMSRIFDTSPDWLRKGDGLGTAEEVEARLIDWAMKQYADRQQQYQQALDVALFRGLDVFALGDALLAGLMMIHLPPAVSPASWNTEEFLHDLQRIFGARPDIGVNEMRTIRRTKIQEHVRRWMEEPLRRLPEELTRHRVIGLFSSLLFAQAAVYAMAPAEGEEAAMELESAQKQTLTRLFGNALWESEETDDAKTPVWKKLADRALRLHGARLREQLQAYQEAMLARATIEECVEAVVGVVARGILAQPLSLEDKRKQLGDAVESMLSQRPERMIPENADAADQAAFVKDLAAWALALYRNYADREERIRQEALSREILRDSISLMIDDVIYASISNALEGEDELTPQSLRRLEADCRLLFRQAPRLADEGDRLMNPNDAMAQLSEWAQNLYQKRIQEIGLDLTARYERYYVLEKIDENWRQHLNGIDELREGIGLRGYGQKDPLLEYKGEAYQMFVKMIDRMNREVVSTLFRVFDVGGELEEQQLRRAEPRNYMATHSQVEIFKQAQAAPQAASPSPATSAGRTAPIVKAISIGRNDPCPCGSGRKYKQCCGKNL
ncbi:hypothetical protein GX408_05635 [bacterium]|nr:hypothetical protein [bacterium]